MSAMENVLEILKPGVIGFRNLMGMQAEENLRERVISMIRGLSMNKLAVLSMFLRKMTGHTRKSTDRTLKMAEAWQDLDGELFLDLTERLHERRLNESRPIDC